MCSIVGMAPVEMHLEPFGDELEVMPESLGQNPSMTLGVDYFDPKSFGSNVDDLSNLPQRFLIHESTPTKKLLQDGDFTRSV
jgi:hypothetical protein